MPDSSPDDRDGAQTTGEPRHDESLTREEGRANRSSASSSSRRTPRSTSTTRGRVGRRQGGRLRRRREQKEGDKKDGKNGKDKKKFRWTPLKLLIAVVLVIAIIVVAIIYILYALSHETTDDAYTTGFIHQISSRVTSNVIELDIVDNQFVHAGPGAAAARPARFPGAGGQGAGRLRQGEVRLRPRRRAEERRGHFQAGLRPDQVELRGRGARNWRTPGTS